MIRPSLLLFTGATVIEGISVTEGVMVGVTGSKVGLVMEVMFEGLEVLAACLLQLQNNRLVISMVLIKYDFFKAPPIYICDDLLE